MLYSPWVMGKKSLNGVSCLALSLSESYTQAYISSVSFYRNFLFLERPLILSNFSTSGQFPFMVIFSHHMTFSHSPFSIYTCRGGLLLLSSFSPPAVTLTQSTSVIWSMVDILLLLFTFLPILYSYTIDICVVTLVCKPSVPLDWLVQTIDI